jgi:hypothetical protein
MSTTEPSSLTAGSESAIGITVKPPVSSVHDDEAKSHRNRSYVLARVPSSSEVRPVTVYTYALAPSADRLAG